MPDCLRELSTQEESLRSLERDRLSSLQRARHAMLAGAISGRIFGQSKPGRRWSGRSTYRVRHSSPHKYSPENDLERARVGHRRYGSGGQEEAATGI
jgi:hypothetical protein